jgi:hypothetical protein
MLLSLLGLFIVLVAALVIGVRWLEKSLWAGDRHDWRLLFPGYREAAEMADRLKILKVYSDAQDDAIGYLRIAKLALDKEYHELYARVHDCDGLEAQVADLKQVLEWTRTSLNDAKQEVLCQMGFAHVARESLKVSEDVRRDQNKELRHRATIIRELKGIPVRKRR